MNAVTPKRALNDSTRMATTDTVLTPRFYTTDFAAMDRIDVSSIRAEWDALMAEFKSDPNKGHFVRSEAFDEFRMADLPEGLQKELMEFLVSSVTAESLVAAVESTLEDPPDIAPVTSPHQWEEELRAALATVGFPEPVPR